MPDEVPAKATAAETPAAAPAKPVRRAAAKPKAETPAAPAPPESSAAASPTAKPATIRRKGAAPNLFAKAAPAAPSAPVSHAVVVDASGLILGRAASLIAQRLLRGEEIVVVHAEKSVITGERSRVISFYVANRARGSKRTGPHYPRYPDRIFRRTVRGMLPHLKTRGKQAYDRLEVHIGCPDGIKAARPDWVSAASARPSVRPLLTLGEVSRLLGARV